MDLNAIGLFRLAGQRLEYLSERQRLVAENVVHANTPGYRAKDLKPFEAMLTTPAPVAPRLTSAVHLAGTLAPQPFRVERQPAGWETTPDGNAVALDEEMMKGGETRDAFALTAGLFQKNIQILRAAWRTN